MKIIIMLGTSEAWLISRYPKRASEPAYYIEDCRISGRCAGLWKEAAELQTNAAGILFGVTSTHSESIQRE